MFLVLLRLFFALNGIKSDLKHVLNYRLMGLWAKTHKSVKTLKNGPKNNPSNLIACSKMLNIAFIKKYIKTPK